MIECMEKLDAGRRAFPCENLLREAGLSYNGSLISEDGVPLLDLYLTRYMKGTAKNFYAVCIRPADTGYHVQITPRRETKHNKELTAEFLCCDDVLKTIERFLGDKSEFL